MGEARGRVRVFELRGEQEPAQLLGHAQHRVMAGVELVPFAAELVGGAALMRLARVLGAAAPDDLGLPFLRPQRVTMSPILSPGSKASASIKARRPMRSRINSATRHTTMPPELVPASTTSF